MKITNVKIVNVPIELDIELDDADIDFIKTGEIVTITQSEGKFNLAYKGTKLKELK